MVCSKWNQFLPFIGIELSSMKVGPRIRSQESELICRSAHVIRNHKAKTSRAVTNIQATNRWAISATPIQNKLSDFVALFKFLRFEPYDDVNAFDRDIGEIWRNDMVEEAVERTKRLISCVMLRRLKTTITLPPREDKIRYVTFGSEEKDYYRRIEQRMPNSAEESRACMSTIQQITLLRKICNLGLAATGGSRMRDEPMAISILTTMDQDTLQNVSVLRLCMGDDTCEQCCRSGILFMSCTPSSEKLDHELQAVYHSRCGLIFCAECAQSLDLLSSTFCICGSTSPCALQCISSQVLQQIAENGDRLCDRDATCSSEVISSKVHALLSDIQDHPDEKR